MNTLHIWPESIIEKDDQATAAFVLEDARGNRKRLWYRLPFEHRLAITENCDPYVLATVFYAMHLPANVSVHGTVSPSLLSNLEEFQATWHSWAPQDYQVVGMQADIEQESEPAVGEATVMPFSGGVDSAFTAWRQRTGRAGRQKEDLQAGLVLHGFDIPLKSQQAFEHALERCRRMLDSLGMQTIPLTTNLRSLGGNFTNTHAPILASCLALLQKRFSVGLVAPSNPHFLLVYPWALPYGSNPLSDAFLSSQAFKIVNDSACLDRIDKIQALAEWPEAMQSLRVCLGQNPDRRVYNCCKCEKCIRNLLSFRLLGMELPSCFPRDVNNWDILRMSYTHPARFRYFEKLVELARQQRVRASWVSALRISLVINRLSAPLRSSGIFRRSHFNKE